MKQETKNLNARHTAWYQLVSAAGAFLDRLKGQVTEENLRDVQVLYDCAQRVMELEGVSPLSDKSFR